MSTVNLDCLRGKIFAGQRLSSHLDLPELASLKAVYAKRNVKVGAFAWHLA